MANVRTAVKDADWVRKSFMIPKESVDDDDRRLRSQTSMLYKFGDTTLGGNIAINAPYQFTRNADLKDCKYHAAGTNNNQAVYFSAGEGGPSKGMGRYYSEAIDDNGVYVTMRFGVPTFNTLTTFFGNFYSADSSRLARTGRSDGFFYKIGKLTGYAIALPFMPFTWVGAWWDFLAGNNKTKYYYLKPAMPLYWNAVTTMANSIASNMGITAHLNPPGYDDTGKQIGDPNKAPEGVGLSKGEVSDYNKLLPDLFKSDGGINIYGVATRYQRLANAYNDAVLNSINKAATSQDAMEALYKLRNGVVSDVPDNMGLDKLWEQYVGTPQYKSTDQSTPVSISADTAVNTATGGATPPATDSSSSSDTPAATPSIVDTIAKDEAGKKSGIQSVIEEAADSVASYWKGDGTANSLKDYFNAERKDGAAWVTFRVDNPGATSESFSSSASESDIASKINSMSSAGRSAKFSLADGNVTGIIGSITSTIGDIASGILSGLSLSGLAALAGNALVDIPKQWESSTATMPSARFTIELRTPYGNAMSRFQDLIVPTCMLLAGALPLSTGPQSYNSPFLVECYSKGRTTIRLGIIDSLEITRGTGNTGWTPNGEPLGIDISFNVLDLSSIMHMPITMWDSPIMATAEAIASGGAGVLLTNDSSYSDYMAVLGSLGVIEQTNQLYKLKKNFYESIAKFEDWYSPQHFMNWAMGTFPGRVITAVSPASNIRDR